MELLNVGKIVNTFGIKGELKVVSRFEMAEKVFKKGSNIVINNNEYNITNVRFHKNNYLVEINNIKDINDVVKFIGFDIYFNKDDLNLKDDEYIISELIDYDVFSNGEKIGIVTDYDNNIINPLIKINDKFYIPLNGDFIVKIDKNNKIVNVKDIEGLML